MNHIKAVLFDIDECLAPTISWTHFTQRLGASPQTHLRIYHDYREGRITYEESKVRLLGLWRETSHANRPCIQHIFATMPLRPEAKPLIHWARSYFKLGIISGAMDIYVQQVARTLGIEDFYANTKLFFDANGNLVDYDYTLDQSGKKVEQLAAFCAKHGLTPEECAVVGDSENDLGTFKATRHGILVGASPSPELAQAAWKTTQSLGGVRKILANLK